MDGLPWMTIRQSDSVGIWLLEGFGSAGRFRGAGSLLYRRSAHVRKPTTKHRWFVGEHLSIWALNLGCDE